MNWISATKRMPSMYPKLVIVDVNVESTIVKNLMLAKIIIIGGKTNADAIAWANTNSNQVRHARMFAPGVKFLKRMEPRQQNTIMSKQAVMFAAVLAVTMEYLPTMSHLVTTQNPPIFTSKRSRELMARLPGVSATAQRARAASGIGMPVVMIPARKYASTRWTATYWGILPQRTVLRR